MSSEVTQSRNLVNGNEYGKIPQTIFINRHQTAIQPMKKRLIDQNRIDIISVTCKLQAKELSTRYTKDGIQKGKEVSHHDNSTNHLGEVLIKKFRVDKLEDNEIILYHDIQHKENDYQNRKSCADHDEQREYQLSAQQRHHVEISLQERRKILENLIACTS